MLQPAEAKLDAPGRLCTINARPLKVVFATDRLILLLGVSDNAVERSTTDRKETPFSRPQGSHSVLVLIQNSFTPLITQIWEHKVQQKFPFKFILRFIFFKDVWR